MPIETIVSLHCFQRVGTPKRDLSEEGLVITNPSRVFFKTHAARVHVTFLHRPVERDAPTLDRDDPGLGALRPTTTRRGW